MSRTASEESRTDFALVPTGGLRTNITPGPVTYGGLFSVQPSGRDLIKVELNGGQIRRALERQYRSDGRDHRLAVSGLRYAHDPSRPLGQRVTSLTLPGGAPVDRNATYTVAVNGFLAAGGDALDMLPGSVQVETECLQRQCRYALALVDEPQ